MAEHKALVSDEKDSEHWKIGLQQYKVAENQISNPKLRKFYKHQNALIESFADADSVLREALEARRAAGDGTEEDSGADARMATNLSLAGNIALLFAKLFVAFTSGSLAVIASSLDSLFDLISGVVLYLTAKSMAKKNRYDYPIGKGRMEPVGVLVFACVMGMLSLQILMESVRRMLLGNAEDDAVDVTTVDIALLSAVIVIKALLYWFCNRIDNSSTAEALAQDHRNDVLTNGLGFAAALLAMEFEWWMDPLGAGLFSIFLIYNWYDTAQETGGMMLGRSAPPDFLSQLTYVAWNHDERVKQVDTVRAFRVGINYIVEVDVVLPPDMSLREAHDVGEELQHKLEKLAEVERAFVHLDFETDHAPEH